MKKVLSKIFSCLGYDSRTVWGKYMKFILPCVMVVIVAMDIVIYAIISNYTDTATNKANQRTVKILSDEISEVFHRYLGDLNMMRHYYQKNSIDEFLVFTRRFTEEHSNKYSYVRLILPDGRSFNSLGNNDLYNVKEGRPYKHLVVEHKDISVNSAHVSELAGGVEVYSISVPVKNDNDSVTAIIAAVFPVDVVERKLNSILTDSSEYFVMVDEANMARVCRGKRGGFSVALDGTSPGAPPRYTDLKDKMVYNRNNAANGVPPYGSWVIHETNGQEILLHYAAIPDTPWVLAHLAQKRIIAKDVTLTFWVLLLTTLVSMVVLLIAIRHITTKVVIRPLEAISRFSNDFAHGKLYSTETRNINSNDELGMVCKNIEEMQQKLVSAVSGIHDTTNDLSRCSHNVIDTVQSVDCDAQVQNVAVENIANSVEQVNVSIRLNSEDATRTHVNSKEIAEDIVSVSKATADTYDCMRRIVEKVKVINDITSHTDLLAINASVEASRAGDHGSGFAVVAAEIRKLSELCHRASTEINRLSEVSLAATTQTVDLVDSISPKIHDNAIMVSRISEACSKQLHFTGAISNAVQQLSEISQNNTVSADKLTVSANVLVNDVGKLNKLVDFFRLDRDRDLRRGDILAAIEMCKSQILGLRSKLLAVSPEGDAETQVVEERIDEALQDADKMVNRFKNN
ncbi:MAG: methyl-accepting chemotaxis protein [Bacteroidales bacterium]|nr:methyl-accepting chemotaxis protein [Bacteroidales bacterium]